MLHASGICTPPLWVIVFRRPPGINTNLFYFPAPKKYRTLPAAVKKPTLFGASGCLLALPAPAPPPPPGQSIAIGLHSCGSIARHRHHLRPGANISKSHTTGIVNHKIACRAPGKSLVIGPARPGAHKANDTVCKAAALGLSAIDTSAVTPRTIACLASGVYYSH